MVVLLTSKEVRKYELRSVSLAGVSSRNPRNEDESSDSLAGWREGDVYCVFSRGANCHDIFPFLYLSFFCMFLLEKFTCHMGASELVSSKDSWPEELTPAQVLFEK